ncbi:MAG TPA: HAMP domain-containing sensor histidine kinase [Puia sp.]|jgi:signal transduction histidine kinase|nr:HAMP domain-containing sensor histidine kinase [Puia sp.]
MPDETIAGRAKDVFFQHISHDIRGAYFGVASICAIVYEKVVSGEEVPLPVAQSLIEASRYYKYLLDQFLEFTRSKIDAVEEVQEEPFDPLVEVRHIVELNRHLAEEKGIGVDIRVDGAFPRNILTDKWKITRIFYNVFVNALKFSPPGSRILIGFALETGHWILKVSDQGKGIPPEKLERLTLSLQTERPIDNPEGKGLGLFITGYLTRLVGGEVSVESTPETGTSFLFRFPLKS